MRIAARRQRELMAIIVSGEMEDVEWMDEDEVDLAGLQMPDMMQSSGLPFVDADHIESP